MNNQEKYFLNPSLIQALLDYAHVLMLTDELLGGAYFALRKRCYLV